MTGNELSAGQADRGSDALKNVNGTAAITARELSDIIAEAIRLAVPAIRVYVLEADITAAQGAVKTVVEQSKF